MAGEKPNDSTELGKVGPIADAGLESPVAAIQEIFRELLEREQIGPTDNFFTHGGNSLLAARLLWKLQSAFEVEVPMRAMFDDPTPLSLARVVEELVRAEFEQAEQAEDS